MEPLVSVIVPVYNVENYLERCAESIFKQTYAHLEIIFVDDGSTDSSGAMLETFSDPRIRVIKQENGGQAAARNAGLDQMTGDYVIMVDSDDYIAPNLVEKCLKTVTQTEADLVMFTSYNVNQSGDMQYIPRNSGHLLTDAGSVPWNKFYTASLWEKLRFPTGYWYEDLGVVPAVVLRAEKPVKLDDALYFYITDRADSQSNLQNDTKFLDVIPMLENVTNELKALDIFEASKAEVETLYMEHLVYRTVLRKIIYLEGTKQRKEVLKIVRETMNSHFPKWEKNGYRSGSGLTAKLKYLAVRLYLQGFVHLGDLVWKVPFEKRRQQTGF
ncbi:glycosyltransferase family 2 protein [Listeria goaensis]|uniref:glycosyltransferase family 2 protein n=1 Tax=Listeria goaensis TaxID=1649188 RepID=UPI000B588692|nr:glycosyltransferase family 2 protein [Listeria goaensis]